MMARNRNGSRFPDANDAGASDQEKLTPLQAALLIEAGREITIVSNGQTQTLSMGGTVPLGYEADGRSLKIVEEEAETVRRLYQLYLDLGSVYAVREAANDLGLRTKGRPRFGAKKDKVGAKDGRDDNVATATTIIGAAAFGVTNIHYILTNPTYAGRIRHRSQTHDGHHPAIIEPDVWDKVQEMLKADAARTRGISQSATVSLLAGKLIDDSGDTFTPSHTNKNGVRIRYYISNRLVTGKQTGKGTMDRGWRLPAPMLESQLAEAILRHLQDRLPIDLSCSATVGEVEQVHRRLAVLSAYAEHHHPAILKCIDRATIMQGRIDIVLIDQCVAELIGVTREWLNPNALSFSAGFQTRKRGVETKLFIGAAPTTDWDDTLIRNIAKAQQFYDAIKQGHSFDQIAKSENLSTRRVMQIIDLAFLAPPIVQSIVTGDQPLALTTKWLSANPMPSDWQAQRRIVATL